MYKKVRTKNLKGLIEEHRKEKVFYRTYEFDNDSYMALLCDINDLLHQLEEKDKIIDETIEYVKQNSEICYSNKQDDDPLKIMGHFMWHTDKLLEILERNINES